MTDQNSNESQVQQPQAQQPQQPQVQQPQVQQAQYQQAQYAPQGAPAKSATVLIVLSVLELLFLGGLFAIIPLVFSIQANSAYKVGDIVGGDAKAKTAKTALIIIAIVGVVSYIALIAMGGMAIFTAGTMQ